MNYFIYASKTKTYLWLHNIEKDFYKIVQISVRNIHNHVKVE